MNSPSGRSSVCSQNGSRDQNSDGEDGAASPSTTQTSVSATSAHSDTDGRTQADRFLSNLKNYIPLGCLSVAASPDSTAYSSNTTWQDVACLDISIHSNKFLESNLQRLVRAGWIRVQSRRSISNFQIATWKIFLLPSDGGNIFVDRHSKKLSQALEVVVSEVDVSPQTWRGDSPDPQVRKFDKWASKNDSSLFYLFNKTPSPNPEPALLSTKYEREAAEDILDSAFGLHGLKTNLYPYQRRSAAMMLQREAVADLQLDPRLEQRTAPDGSLFFYNAWDMEFRQNPRYYESCRGGILAESMGLGKTLMCLALILATKDHLPRIPIQHNHPPTRPVVASLADMAVSCINRTSFPWKVEIERMQHAGHIPASFVERLRTQPPFYEIPFEPARWNRWTVLPPPRQICLSSATIIVVPRNLFKQWQSEISKHVEANALEILVMEDSKQALPAANELRQYDVILFSRQRFENEINDGSDNLGRRLANVQRKCTCPYIGATRERDCHCASIDDLYDSPLKHVHFKRLIIDEGHFSSYMNTTAGLVANRLVTADHRWIVSGTPAKDLLGVEVDTSAAENLWHAPQSKNSRDAILQQKKNFGKGDYTSGAIKCLGSFATNFLKIRPWAASTDGFERSANWDDYIFRHEAVRRRTYTAFSDSLVRTLNAMVIKTRPEDVERDIELPPLTHKIVRLQPSFYDKLTSNLFTLVLTANAVTSERTDADYLFHRNSAKARYQLIANLRQSAFCWTGFSEDDVLASLKNSTGYLDKENAGCTDIDRELLKSTMACTDAVLTSPGWVSMSRSHELGFFLEDWPGDSAPMWSFAGSASPLLTGISQLLEAQKHVNDRIMLDDPSEGLGSAGVKALAPTRRSRSTSAAEVEEERVVVAEKPVLTRSGIPLSSIGGEPLLRKASLSRTSPKSAKRKMSSDGIDQGLSKRRCPFGTARNEHEVPTTESDDSIDLCLSQTSPLAKTRIVGTTSAKLSYLVSQVLKHASDEKMLIFYDGDNAAYYIAQALELFDIKHEIYARSLKAAMKSEYVVRFNQDPSLRVLLMDVKQAAYGLNLCSASRVYFVNPVYRPNIEAQAIKRAHRIGQTRAVHVETLVLVGTVEEKMLERARQMTSTEHNDAKVLEDDGGIRKIIQEARVMDVTESERASVSEQMAPIEEPQQLWRVKMAKAQPAQ